MPQIEVSFDIDANGILKVSAKNISTSKEQNMIIKASSGLSEDEIKKMVRDAEMHVEEDRKFDELVTTKNKADAAIHSIEKTLEKDANKINEEERKKYEALCLGQSAAKTAKQIVVFVTRQDLWSKRAKWNYEQLKSNIQGTPTKLEKRGLHYYSKLMPLAYRNDIFG